MRPLSYGELYGKPAPCGSCNAYRHPRAKHYDECWSVQSDVSNRINHGEAGNNRAAFRAGGCADRKGDGPRRRVCNELGREPADAEHRDPRRTGEKARAAHDVCLRPLSLREARRAGDLPGSAGTTSAKSGEGPIAMAAIQSNDISSTPRTGRTACASPGRAAGLDDFLTCWTRRRKSPELRGSLHARFLSLRRGDETGLPGPTGRQPASPRRFRQRRAGDGRRTCARPWTPSSRASGPTRISASSIGCNIKWRNV